MRNDDITKKLSGRLRLVASFVPEGSWIADIGTDHGYLPIYLSQKGAIRGALAADVREGPLSRAREHIEACRESLSCPIETRLSDGLLQIRPEEADTVIIAGMGGELVLRILREGSHMWNSVADWILSPQSDLYKVRRFLAEQGFAIRDEAMIRDEGKFYTVLRVQRGAMRYESPAWYRFGGLLIARRDPVLRDYLGRERRRVTEILAGLGRERAPGELLEELSWIEEAEHEMQ